MAAKPELRVLEVLMLGSGTGVGKTQVTRLLVLGLRALGRRVWVHKPIACGGWDGASAEDGRVLGGLAGDGQSPGLICPLQFPTPAAPALAAQLEGVTITVAQLRSQLQRCRGDQDLVVEGAGGILSPLSSDRLGILAVLAGSGIPALVVCTPSLGTLNATALTCREARREGQPLLGLILNEPTPPGGSVAEEHAALELCALTGLPILAAIRHARMDSSQAQAQAQALALAQAVLAAVLVQPPPLVALRA